MDERQRQEILRKAKIYFKNNIVENHKENTKKLIKLESFNINPFTHHYLANFAFGDDSAENLAKALVYPRVMGTSISTTFGNALQGFCSEVLDSFASTTQGIDIEFTDTIDGRHKYCQIKSGPNTINHDDVTTIINHFTSIKNIARTNRNTDFNATYDCVVGVFYGAPSELSASYRAIKKQYDVFIGEEFWHRLTGDKDFYYELITVFSELAVEIDGRELLEEVIQSLTKQIQEIQKETT